MGAVTSVSAPADCAHPSLPRPLGGGGGRSFFSHTSFKVCLKTIFGELHGVFGAFRRESPARGQLQSAGSLASLVQWFISVNDSGDI